MAKLIRDLIPADMIEHGYTSAEIVQVSGDEKIAWLLTKLVEEANEALADFGSLAELADVFEVARSIWIEKGGTQEGLIAAADNKRERRGGFDQGYLWVNNDDPSEGAVLAAKCYAETEAKGA